MCVLGVDSLGTLGEEQRERGHVTLSEASSSFFCAATWTLEHLRRRPNSSAAVLQGRLGLGGSLRGEKGGLSDNNAQLLSVVFNAMFAFYTGPSHLCLELPR